ncbi:MAG: protein kinase [Gammaproteobacteria bacterium]|nr:protein kinase [Gammaproteobacteria bacterium]
MKNSIQTFGLRPGRVLAQKYEVISLLGSGWEGEVYKIREVDTGIDRAAKLFFPVRNIKNKTIKANAKQLHRLKDCNMVIHYHNREVIQFQRQKVVVFISEYVEGELLSDYLKKQRGKRLTLYKAVHLLHALCVGIEEIHLLRDYHGDIHEGNIVVNRLGLRYHLKILDFLHNDEGIRKNQRADIIDLVTLFYELLGGRKFYAKQPQAVKDICRGLKKTLILERFKTVEQLRRHLEQQDWGKV